MADQQTNSEPQLVTDPHSLNTLIAEYQLWSPEAHSQWKKAGVKETNKAGIGYTARLRENFKYSAAGLSVQPSASLLNASAFFMAGLLDLDLRSELS